jgi:DNA-binding response OmpR family regulator
VLVARVRAALRRAAGPVEPGVLRRGDLEIDSAAHTVSRAGRPVHLTPNEFKLLVALARHPGQTLSREQLLDELHGPAPAGALAGFDRSVDSHVKNLRRKLEDDPDAPRLIETVYGIGYRLSVE